MTDQQTKVCWKSASNIALVKYWGKKKPQIPLNPSISFTLNNASTTTSVELLDRKSSSDDSLELTFLFEGETNETFGRKIRSFLTAQLEAYPWLTRFKLKIESSNTFPHSTGIASSASAMSALALAIVDIDRQLTNKSLSDDGFLRAASYLSRLGSGSACRSVYPTLGVWGKSSAIQDSSDEYAVAVAGAVDPIFHNYCDSILIVDSNEKAVSSRAGHALMDGNPFAEIRYRIANENLGNIFQAMKTGDMDCFIEIVEAEALMLHALMMTSEPSYILMRPNTLAIIEKLRNFRRESEIPVCFTLDAGPNVHMLYPAAHKDAVQSWMNIELKSHCEGGRIIDDHVGKGPEKLI